jgi:hypothetical protein
MTNGIKGLIIPLILDILMKFVSLILIFSIRLTLTSYFFILINSSN